MSQFYQQTIKHVYSLIKTIIQAMYTRLFNIVYNLCFKEIRIPQIRIPQRLISLFKPENPLAVLKAIIGLIVITMMYYYTDTK